MAASCLFSLAHPKGCAPPYRPRCTTPSAHSTPASASRPSRGSQHSNAGTYTGAELTYGQASIEFEGGDREEGSLVFGASNDTTSVIGGVSFNDRDIIFARDLPWNNTGASVYGNSFTTITGGFDNFDWTSYGGGGACEA